MHRWGFKGPIRTRGLVKASAWKKKLGFAGMIAEDTNEMSVIKRQL